MARPSPPPRRGQESRRWFPGPVGAASPVPGDGGASAAEADAPVAAASSSRRAAWLTLRRCLAHRAEQVTGQHGGHAEHDEEPERARRNRVVATANRRHRLTASRCPCIPANRSSSGFSVSTSDLARWKSSVGHAARCTSCGQANQPPSGSIWVAWAISAWSRTVEVVGARHPGGDLVPRLVRAVHPLLQPLPVRRLQAAPHHLLVQRHQPVPVERGEVVELERLPGLAAVPGSGPGRPPPRTPRRSPYGT